jgi:hypothetical protein
VLKRGRGRYFMIDLTYSSSVYYGTFWLDCTSTAFTAASAKLELIEAYGASTFIDGQILAYCGVEFKQEHQGWPGRSSANCPLTVVRLE